MKTNGHRNGTATKPAPDELLPHSIEAEEALLGALLIDQDMIIEVGYLEASDFYLGRHSWLYQVIKDLSALNRPADLVTLSDELERRGQLADLGGPAMLTSLIIKTPHSGGAPHYAKLIYRDSIRRKLIQAAADIVQSAYGSDEADPEVVLGEALGRIAEIDAGRVDGKGPQAISRVAGKFLAKAEEIEKTGLISGLPTGLSTLDVKLGGLEKGKLYLLAGRPGMGKSGLALSTAKQLAKVGKRVLIFSLEMPEEDVIARLVAQEAGVPYDRIYSGQMSGEDWSKVYQSTARVENWPIWIDEQPLLRMSVLKARAHRQIIKSGIDIIIIDHLGLTRADKRGSTYEEVSAIADAALAMAKDLAVPVLGLLQLNRDVESRQNKRPLLSDLRDSGKWEENAHGIMFVYRDEYYNPDTEYPHLGEVILAKNRGGKTGIASVYWKASTMQFVDLKTETQRLNDE